MDHGLQIQVASKLAKFTSLARDVKKKENLVLPVIQPAGHVSWAQIGISTCTTLQKGILALLLTFFVWNSFLEAISTTNPCTTTILIIIVFIAHLFLVPIRILMHSDDTTVVLCRDTMRNTFQNYIVDKHDVTSVSQLFIIINNRGRPIPFDDITYIIYMVGYQ